MYAIINKNTLTKATLSLQTEKKKKVNFQSEDSFLWFLFCFSYLEKEGHVTKKNSKISLVFVKSTYKLFYRVISKRIN